MILIGLRKFEVKVYARNLNGKRTRQSLATEQHVRNMVNKYRMEKFQKIHEL